MSENKVVPIKSSDFTDHDTKALQEFENEGAPGLYSIDDATVGRMLELYLHGKTYREISMITNRSKVLVLALAQKLNWYTKKLEYLRDINETITQRTLEAHVVGQDFLLKLKHVFEKKIGSKIDAYLRTGDESHANAIDMKEIDKYIKTLETLDKRMAPKKPKSSDKSPAVGINVGEGVTVTKTSENTVEISPTDKPVRSALADLAEFRRREEANKSNDIKKNNSEGEKK